MTKKIKNFVADVEIPVTAGAGVYGSPKGVTLPTGWPTLEGVRVVVKDKQDDADFEISLQDEHEGVLHDFTHNTDWAFDESCPVQQRMKPISSRGDGNRVTIYTKLSQGLNANILKYQVIFVLSKEA